MEVVMKGARAFYFVLVSMIACVWMSPLSATAATIHVSLSGSHTPPYDDWTKAATNIQTAVAAAVDGDTVLVTNGVYASNWGLTNITSGVGTQAVMVCIDKGITVCSVNGAEYTTVQRTTIGATNFFRIFFLNHSDAVLDGFTIKNGYPKSPLLVHGGGVVVTNGLVRNCVITENRVDNPGKGGGLMLYSGGVATNCQLIGNYGSRGGSGLYLYYGGVARDCVVNCNTAQWNTGGAYLERGGLVENCVISGNYDTSDGFGSGAHLEYGGTLRNCLIIRNTTRGGGGGVECNGSGGRVENCTIYGNTAGSGGRGDGGGVCCKSGGTIVNSIIYGNYAPSMSNYMNSSSGWSYTNCCTMPHISGAGNISADPMFVNPTMDDFRLLPGSPCINAGVNQNWMTGASDLDGHARVLDGTVDIGAYELDPAVVACGFSSGTQKGFDPLTVVFSAHVEGFDEMSGLSYRWDFRNSGSWDQEGVDKNIVTNVYEGCGIYSVRLQVTNDSMETADCVISNYIKVGSPAVYVASDGSETYPYTNWTTAAKDIQSAIDVGVDGSVVWVTNGIYSITNQIEVLDGVAVRSVNGPTQTRVQRIGATVNRIFYMKHSNAVVEGFTITGGKLTDPGYGGGVYMAKGTVSNCVIAGNYGDRGGGGVFIYDSGLVRDCVINCNTDHWNTAGVYLFRGGVVENSIISSNNAGNNGYGSGARLESGGTLRNCLIIGNTTVGRAGGVECMGAGGRVESCTIVSNTAGTSGGGLYCYSAGTIVNSIISGNTATLNPNTANYSNYSSGWSYTNCCTTPMPSVGSGNITNDPMFALPATNNYRLLAESPCVNAGTNQSWMLDAVDLDGNSRIFRGIVDIGAYERTARKIMVIQMR